MIHQIVAKALNFKLHPEVAIGKLSTELEYNVTVRSLVREWAAALKYCLNGLKASTENRPVLHHSSPTAYLTHGKKIRKLKEELGQKKRAKE